MSKGLIDSIILGVLVTVTCFIIILVLPNMLWIWTRFYQGSCKVDIAKLIFYACPQAPVTLETVFKPEYIPLTADHALFTVLETNDTSTGLQIQELLALAAFQGSDIITLNGNSYNVSKIVESKLDFLVSTFNYKFILVSPIETNPSSFIVSPSIIQIGKYDISPQYFSMTSITLPDLKKTTVMLMLLGC